jgi:hypothetical protein
MATPPIFVAGQVLTAAQMNAVGQWVVVAETTFTASSTITASSVFTSDYQTYLFVARYTTTTTGNGDFQLAVGGVAAATNYTRQVINASSTTVSASRTTGATNLPGFLSNTDGAFEANVFAYINGPNLVAPTLFNIQRNSSSGSFNNIIWSAVSAVHTTSTAYDGFVITMGSGTTTGTYTLYGLSK